MERVVGICVNDISRTDLFPWMLLSALPLFLMPCAKGHRTFFRIRLISVRKVLAT